MSDELDGLDATEKAGIENALNRCRGLAAQIASKLRNKRPEQAKRDGRSAAALWDLNPARDRSGSRPGHSALSAQCLDHPQKADIPDRQVRATNGRPDQLNC